MPKKKKKDDAFRSIKIIGSRAQRLWSQARLKLHKENARGGRNVEFPRKEEMPEVMVSISIGSVVKAAFAILAIVLGAWLVFVLRDKLIILLLAFFLAIVIDPAVKFLEGWRVPRGLAVVLVYLAFLSLAVFLLASLIPIVAVQIQSLARLISQSADAFLADPRISIPFFPDALNDLMTTVTQSTLQSLNVEDRATALFRFGQQLSTSAQSSLTFAVNVAGSVVNFFVSFILVLVLTFFIQMEKEKIRDYVRILFPRRMRSYLDVKSEAIHVKMGQWIRGQLTLCLAVGVLVFIALYVVGMHEYALTLALLAGFTEFIPVVGPILAAVPAVLIGATQEGPVWALVIAGVYYAIQWSENNLLVPLIMKRAVGLSPIAVMFAMLVGISFPDTIHPILGVILSVPITTILTIFIRDYQESRRVE